MKKFNIVGFILTLFILLIIQSLSSQTNYDDIIDKKVKAIEQKVINWRHQIGNPLQQQVGHGAHHHHQQGVETVKRPEQAG